LLIALASNTEHSLSFSLSVSSAPVNKFDADFLNFINFPSPPSHSTRSPPIFVDASFSTIVLIGVSIVLLFLWVIVKAVWESLWESDPYLEQRKVMIEMQEEKLKLLQQERARKQRMEQMRREMRKEQRGEGGDGRGGDGQGNDDNDCGDDYNDDHYNDDIRQLSRELGQVNAQFDAGAYDHENYIGGMRERRK
jgi:hypothetical protein